MALAVDAEHFAVRIRYRDAVVIGRPVPFEKRDRDDHAQLARQVFQGEHTGMFPRWVSGREPFRILPRAEVDALKQLGREHNLRALFCGFPDETGGLQDIGGHVFAIGCLNGRNRDCAPRHSTGSCCVMQ
jgi:hypothetical protein